MSDQESIQHDEVYRCFEMLLHIKLMKVILNYMIYILIYQSFEDESIAESCSLDETTISVDLEFQNEVFYILWLILS